MPYDLTRPLVIGISSRALFDLEVENRIFEEQGLAVYEDYQVKHETDILQKGSAFQLVKAFLDLNRLQDDRLVEVIVMSRNSPNTSLRIFNSIDHYGLDITRAALSGGAPIAPYLKAFDGDDNMVAPGVLSALGNCYANTGDLSAAVSKFIEAAKAADNNTISPYCLLQAGIIYEKQGKKEDALKVYTQIKDKYFASIQAMDIDKYINRVK